MCENKCSIVPRGHGAKLPSKTPKADVEIAKTRWASAAALAVLVIACERSTDSSALSLGIVATTGSSSASPAAGVSSLPELAHAVTAVVAHESTGRPWPDDDKPRVYPKVRNFWVRYEPSHAAGWTGFLWVGGWAVLRDPNPVRGAPGCKAWYAIEPRGYVCVDGVNATLDRNDPVLQGMWPHAPRVDLVAPHHYGESRDAQRYRTLPSREEQRQREPGLEAHLANIAVIRTGAPAKGFLMQGVDVTPAPPSPLLLPELPKTMQEDRIQLRYLSTVSWSREVEHDGRTWLLAGDYKIVPKDRVAPYPESTFRGVPLGEGVTLPIAFFRGKDRPKYRRGDDGSFTPSGDVWKRLAWVKLTGHVIKAGDITYLETSEGGLYVNALDAVVPTPQATTPWGAPVGGEDTTGRAPSGRGTWIETSVLGGWLVAFEGTKAVYATMISPGRGGIPVPGKDPLKTASTPTGSFPLTGKFATATMVAPNEFIHSDVPWAQNFHGPHAIHGAYWHDRWGEKMSAGCVNVSLPDGHWLFHWTEPPIAEGWHGVRWEPSLGPATRFIVHP